MWTYFIQEILASRFESLGVLRMERSRRDQKNRDTAIQNQLRIESIVAEKYFVSQKKINSLISRNCEIFLSTLELFSSKINKRN